MSVDDYGIEVLKKAAVEITPGDKSDYKIQVDVLSTVIPGSNYEYAEDSVAGSGDVGAFILAVRRDADAATAADGDYTELQVDETGYLKTVDNAGNVLLTAISGKLPASLGSKLSAASFSVVLASRSASRPSSSRSRSQKTSRRPPRASRSSPRARPSRTATGSR